MTLHEAAPGAMLERTDGDGRVETVVVVSHYSSLFGTGTTYRHYGSGAVLTLDENADPGLRPENGDDWEPVPTGG